LNRRPRRWLPRLEQLEDRVLLAADVFEPNDTWDQAFDLVAGVQTHTGLTIHAPGNDDWYKWTAMANGTLNLDARFAHTAGDLDLRLLDANLETIASSASTDDDEHIVVPVSSGETYYVHVFGYRDATNDYILELDGPFPLPPDRFEPNDSLEDPADLEQGDQAHPELNVHRVGEFVSSDDFYRWTAPADGDLNVEIHFVHALGDLDLRLYDSDGNELALAASADDNEHLTAPVTPGTSYVIQVYGYGDAVNPRYTLVIDSPEPTAALDFGDAPAESGYPTVLGQDGARHWIWSSGPWLGDRGDRPDIDPDGQLDAHALGDDHDGNDDEDGVEIPALVQGEEVFLAIEVQPAAGLPEACVDAWIDFNGDGAWQHPDEQVFAGCLTAGIHEIPIAPPPDAVPGMTFSRFRISTASGLLPTGAAEDGEVEDHEVAIHPAAALPDLYPVEFAVDPPGSIYPGDAIGGYTFLSVANQGTADAGPFSVGIYLSEDPDITPDDILLEDGQVAVSGLDRGSGADLPLPHEMRIPEWLAPGTYWLGAMVDEPPAAEEADEQNNLAVVPIDISLAPRPDLTVSVFGAPSTAAPGEDITAGLSAGFSNIGSVDAGPSRVGVYLSTDATITSADTLLVGGAQMLPGIPAMSSLANPFPPLGVAISVPESVAPGNYYIGALMDDLGTVTESDETNNARTRSIAIQLKPDLYVYSLSVDVNEAAQGEIVGGHVSVSVGNQGPVDAGQFKLAFYLSPGHYPLVNGEATVPSLAAGATATVNVSAQATIPATVPPGTYSIVAVADDGDVIDEKDEGNNTKATSITILGPDLVVESFHCERGAAGLGQTVGDLLSLWVRNAGSVAAGAFTVGVYLSNDPLITTGDWLLSSGTASIASLASGASTMALLSPVAAVPTAAAITPGTYYIGALVDTANAVDENSETNNTASEPLTITADTWTILSYFVGDNNREWQAATNLAQLEQVNTSGTPINIVTLLDRHPNGAADGKATGGFWNAKIPSNGSDWSDTRWGPVTYDGNTSTFATLLSPLRPATPELNTGDPAVFVEYVQRAMALAPAQHYALWFYDHGSMGAFGQDDPSGGNGLEMKELESAFDQIPFVDVVLYDACLMQDIEVATELIGDAAYVVASQHGRWAKNLGSNIYMDVALNWLTQNPNASAEQVAKQIWKQDAHAPQGDCSVIDLELIPNLNDAIDKFAMVALNMATAADWQRLKAARTSVPQFAWNTYLDLWQYLDNVVKDTQISATIRANAGVARDLVDPLQHKVVIAQKGGGSGLTVYLPERGSIVRADYTGQTYTFVDMLSDDGTRWRQFLLKLPGDNAPLSFVLADPLRDQIDDEADTALALGPSEVASWVESNINDQADVDFVSFDAAAGDQLYAELHADPLNGGLQPRLTLYDTDQTTLLRQWTGDAEGNVIAGDPVVLPRGGTYYVAVTSAGNDNPLDPTAGESTGAYTLVVTYGLPERVAPQLAADAMVDFGTFPAAPWSWETADLTLTNHGGATLEISALSLPEDSPFVVPYVPIDLPLRLGPRESIDLRIGVHSEMGGPLVDTLHITANDLDGDHAVELRAEALPDVWNGSDIGEATAPGSHWLDSGVWTVEAAGRGTGGNADAVHYVYRPLAGDGEIIARIADFSAEDADAEAGVMIRANLEPDAPQATMAVTLAGAGHFVNRRTPGEEADRTTRSGGQPQRWVRLTRQGDMISGYVSTDGLRWEPVGSAAIAMVDPVYIGLAAAGHQDDQPARVSIDQVTPAPKPDLIVSYFAAPATAGPGEDITAHLDGAFSNMGLADAGPSRVGVYLSTDVTITASDTLLVGGTGMLPSITAMSSPLMPFPPLTATMSIPESVAPGSYFIGLLVDDQQVVTESDESNNDMAKPITIKLKPDLQVTTFSGPASGYTNQQVGGALIAMLTNAGPVDVTTPLSVGVYLSTDPTISASDTKLTGNSTQVTTLAAGASLALSFDSDLTIPADVAPGNYYLGVLVDEGDVVDEKAENNNGKSSPFTLLEDLWTVMVFMNGDDDTSTVSLEPWAISDINEMESVDLPPSVNVVVQLDRIAGHASTNVPAGDTLGGNWTDTRRAIIAHDTNTNDVTTAFTRVVPGGNSELNMGTTQAIVDFVTWGQTQRPASKYALILWDHGNGWRDMSNDHSNNDELTMSELRAALQQIGSVDLLGFDMCLMGMSEVVTEAIGHADYVVASEEIEPLRG
jgi:subtilase family serine protease/regulation of enolase protein 1 (concanavalin A-like superfamily)